MQTINLVNVMGYVGADADHKNLTDGTDKTTISIGTNIGTGERQKTQWHTALFYGESAKVVANLKKGDAISVTGYINYRKWTDPKNQQNRISPEIHVQDLRILSNPKKTQNQINILGHVGQSAQYMQFGDNSKTTVSVATNTGFGDKQKTQWHTVIFWGKAAEVTAKLKKGDVIYVSGYVEYRSWEDKETKQKRLSPEINAQQFSIVIGEVGRINDSPINENLSKQNQHTNISHDVSKGDHPIDLPY